VQKPHSAALVASLGNVASREAKFRVKVKFSMVKWKGVKFRSATICGLPLGCLGVIREYPDNRDSSKNLTQKGGCVAPDCVIHGNGIHRGGERQLWAEEHRRTYRREGDGYPSDLRDAERARLEPLAPMASPGGRPRKTDMRAAMNAILYLLRTGCPCRYLPHDGFPPRSTVYNIFRKFQREGTWEAIWAELHMALRERMGREASPSAAVLDSQSVKSAEKGAVKTTKWVTTPVRR
jgi:transposase